jgi:hypothetical protein
MNYGCHLTLAYLLSETIRPNGNKLCMIVLLESSRAHQNCNFGAGQKFNLAARANNGI